MATRHYCDLCEKEYQPTVEREVVIIVKTPIIDYDGKPDFTEFKVAVDVCHSCLTERITKHGRDVE